MTVGRGGVIGPRPETAEDPDQGGASWNWEKAEVDANDVVLVLVVLLEVGDCRAIGMWRPASLQVPGNQRRNIVEELYWTVR